VVIEADLDTSEVLLEFEGRPPTGKAKKPKKKKKKVVNTDSILEGIEELRVETELLEVVHEIEEVMTVIEISQPPKIIVEIKP
jgi:hypothetical protein